MDTSNHIYGVRKLRFDTPASNFMFKRVEEQLRKRHSGMTFVSRPRQGISESIKLVVEGFSIAYKELPVFSINALDGCDNRPGPAWARLLAQIASALSDTRDPICLQTRAKNTIATLALHNKVDQALLIVDRAHGLSMRDFSILTILEDDLRSLDIQLTVCLCGYDSLLQRRMDLLAEGQREPVQRYMFSPEKFFGIRNAPDLVEVLEEFDSTLFGPDEVMTISQYFYPEAWKGGWRLSHEAMRAWASMSSYLHEEDPDAGIELEYVFDAVCNVLEEGGGSSGRHLPPDNELWVACVKKTGLMAAREIEAQLRNVRERKRKRH